MDTTISIYERVKELSNLSNNLLVSYKSIEMNKKRLQESINENESKIEALYEQKAILEKTKPYIDDIVEKFSISALKRLEELLCVAVESIFTDRDYRVEIDLTEKRGLKCAEVFLVENEIRSPLTDDHVGGGVLVALSFIVQCFYIVQLNLERIMFLDEALTFVSSEYLPAFMQFMKELTSSMGIVVVMITHDTRFHEYANRVYGVSKGEYKLEF